VETQWFGGDAENPGRRINRAASVRLLRRHEAGPRLPVMARPTSEAGVAFALSSETMAADQPQEMIGRVLSVRGSQATVGLPQAKWNEPDERRVTVGRYVGIRSPDKTIVGVVTDTSIQTMALVREEGFTVTATVDLMGEIRKLPNGGAGFQRGVTDYPMIGDAAVSITVGDLKLIYDITASETIEIGTLQQDQRLPAYVNIDEMLSKHFAILGTTGVGKSSGVAVILGEILARRPELRIFLIDPHNEYGQCFGDRAQVLNPGNLRLPFWVFNFEETLDVLYRGRPTPHEEIEVLAELLPVARRMYNVNRERRADPRAVGYTVDTPVPYRLTDLTALLEQRIGKLEYRAQRAVCSHVLARIESLANDARYAFMFENANVGGDTMSSVLSELFRLPTDGKPMTIMQLAGFPSEVVDAVVSVLGRMAFDFGLWSDGALPLLFIAEEAHRYASADHNIGFGPTRRAISRIAKEGRKYGVYLGLISQRPAELDPTIISQCSTLFVMRMANDRDQALIRSAVSDAAASLLGFIPSLGTREVFAFGEAVKVPTRLRFKELPPEARPKSDAVSAADADFSRLVDQTFVDVVVDRWRGATLNARMRSETSEAAAGAATAGEGTPGDRRADPERHRLKKAGTTAAG
jgi:DNA helicase HerA-like ATPase